MTLSHTAEKWLAKARGWLPGKSGRQAFRCNICGLAQLAAPEAFGRETASCDGCGSTVRMRSIVHALSMELFGSAALLPDFPERPDLVGAGMSDWPGYAQPLAEKLSYRNTFLHQEPRLDITAPTPEDLGSLDFLISTDVFEHVDPPVASAFENARRLLKPEGVFVFSVPYQLEGDTIEHFPELFEYSLKEEQPGQFVLHNTTRGGEEQRFDDLVFHGGPGSTLELRIFSLPALLRHFEEAGFEPPTIYAESHAACGMIHDVNWSLTMSARPRQ